MKLLFLLFIVICFAALAPLAMGSPQVNDRQSARHAYASRSAPFAHHGDVRANRRF